MTTLRIPITEESQSDLKDFIKSIVLEAVDEVKAQPTDKDYLTQKETEKYLGVSYGTLQKWKALGLKSFKLEGIILYSRKSIQEFIESQEQ